MSAGADATDTRTSRKKERFSSPPVSIAKISGVLSDVTWAAHGEDSGHRMTVTRTVSPVWWRRILLIWVVAVVFFLGAWVFGGMPIITAVAMMVVSLVVIAVVTAVQRVLTDEDTRVTTSAVIDRPLFEGLVSAADQIKKKISHNGVPGFLRRNNNHDDHVSPDQAVGEIDALFSRAKVVGYHDKLFDWYSDGANIRTAVARGWGVRDCGCMACKAVAHNGGVSFSEPGVVVHNRMRLAGADREKVRLLSRQGFESSVTGLARSINDPSSVMQGYRDRRYIKTRDAAERKKAAKLEKTGEMENAEQVDQTDRDGDSDES